MEIIPAIDIIDGKCVRLTRGNYGTKKIYSGDPLKVALAFQNACMKKLHLVDLDGAKEGKIKNWETIKKIAKNTNLLIEFGGGIRGEKDIKKLLNLGINRVIVGSIALEESQKLKNFLKKFGKEKIVIAADIKGNKVCYKGWRAEAKKELSSFLKDLDRLGVKGIICTDIERDGTLLGPNFSLYRTIVKKFPDFNIIASGGIKNVQDLKKLEKIGVAGVIIGKAIYENKISLNDLKSFRR